MSHLPHAQRAFRNVCIAIPHNLLALVDEAAKVTDTTRSQWVRDAIYEKLGKDKPAERKKLSKGWKVR